MMQRLALATTLFALTAGAVAAEDSKPRPKPVLMVIANQDFYHREYFDPAVAELPVIVYVDRDVIEMDLPLEVVLSLVEDAEYVGEFDGDPVFAIDTILSIDPGEETDAAVPHTPVINNTIYGGETPTGDGIR